MINKWCDKETQFEISHNYLQLLIHRELFWAALTTNSANKFQGNHVAKKNSLALCYSVCC